MQQIIKDLGPTGLLVVGLYFFMHKPLVNISRSIKKLNGELSEILAILKGVKWPN